MTTADNEIIVFGGHSSDIEWLRHYDHDTKKVTKMATSSGAWLASWLAGWWVTSSS